MSSNTIKVDLKLSVKKESEWSSSNPVLGLGRIAISSDKYNAFKIGDGTSTWTELSYNRAIASDVSSWAKQSTKPSYSKSEVGLSNVDNVKQIAGLTSGTTANHVVVFGSNGYTVKDSGFTIGKSVPSNAVFTDTVYTHPTGSGNKHIPSGGSSGQILRWSSDGVAVWGDENTVSYGTGNATTLGLTKLYTGTGTNTDGSMTQNAITTALNGKANSSHTHNYAGSSSAGGAANSVKTSLIIKLNGGDTEGTDLFTFNGATAKTVNVTPSSIGAAASSHGTHVTYGTSAPKANGTASTGSASSVSRSDHVHPLQTTVSGNAGSATKLATARTLDGVSFNGSANITHFGTCSTAAATAAKTVSLTGFTLATGAVVTVKFSATNTAANPTLNVNGTGAKAIMYRGSAISAGYLAANRVYTFVYDGTDYELIGDINTDTNTTYSTGNAVTPGLTKLYTGTGSNTDGTMTQDAITDQLLNKASSTHTHNYAGSSSAGGAATSANKVNSSLVVKLNSGSTEGTNMFTFNGSAAKTVNITASAIGAVTSGHTHTHANISDFDEAVEALLPTTLPNPQGLTISLNGTSQGAYTGSAAKSINITPSSIGAATSSHTHAATQVTGLTASRALVSNSSGQITASAVTSTELGYLDGVTSSIQTQLNGKAASSHTHKYAGSSSAGGVANSAAKLNTSAGSATKPVYFDENGIPVACTYTLGKSVPSNAVFTDTTYSTGTSSVAGITKLYTSTGTSTDGTMTRSAITTALNGKASSSHDHSNASASRDGFLSSAMYSQIVEIGDPLTRTEIEAICTY